MKFKKILNLIVQCSHLIKPFIYQNILFIFLTELIVGLTLIFPLILRYLIDDILTMKNWNLFPNFVLMMSVALVISRILSLATNIIYNRFSVNIEEKARNDLFRSILKKNMQFFNEVDEGDLVDRLMRSPEQLHTIPSLYAERLLSSIATIIVVFIIIININTSMALFSIIVTPLFVILYIKSRKLFYEQVRDARQESACLTNFYLSTIRNVKHVKNMVYEEDEKEISDKSNRALKKLGIKYSLTGAIVNNSVQILTKFNQLGVLIYGSVLVNNGVMSIGTLVAFYSYLELLYTPVVSIIQTLTELNSSIVGMERYLEYYNEKNEENYSDGLSFKPSKMSIEFEDVTFSYSKNVILKNLSFSIDHAEKVLLVGKSGIGKTTIISLLKRFYQYESGSIKIGDTNIESYNLRELRKNIMYVTQDSFFSPVSLRDNFKKVNPNITETEIIDALNKAAIYDDIINSDKEGLDTILTRNGDNFSGGQKRRISIAMVFASNASIIILDEPFVGLDRYTSNKIWNNLKTDLANKTVLVIDHNFTDTDFFNKVLEFDKDRILRTRF